MGEFLGLVHVRITVAVLACAIAGVTAAGAHEVGTTRVVVTIESGRFAVDISTDAAAMLNRLEAAARQPISASLDAAEYERRLRTRSVEVLRACGLRFGEEEAIASIDVAVPEAQIPSGGPSSDVDAFVMPRARVRLGGVLPADSPALAWRYDLSATTYQLDVVSNGRTETQWLEGGQWSAPSKLSSRRISGSQLARSALLGVARVLPGGVDQILFLVGIYLAARRWRPLVVQAAAFAAAELLAFVVCRGTNLGAGQALAGPAGIVVGLSIAWAALAALINFFPEGSGRWRVALLAAFGLAHGVALASARGTAEIASNFLVGTLAFGVGLQGGQALVFLTAAFLLGAPSGDGRRQVAVPASVSIGMTGLYWTVLRLTLS